MRINHNLSALNAWKNMSVNDTGQNKSLEKLSSGLRIGRAADDAAGLSISEKMRGQISGLNQASRNAQDGISLLQTAEGALQETHTILQRMRELAVQAASDTVTDQDRVEIQEEIDALAVEIRRISTDTQFNTQELLDGTFTNKTIHIGANENQNLKVDIGNMAATSLKVGGAIEGQTLESHIVTGNATVAIGAAQTYAGTETVRLRVVGTGDNAGTLHMYNSATGQWGASLGAIGGGSINWEGVDITVTGLSDGDTTETFLMGSEGGIYVGSQWSANSAITTINNAINTVSGERSKLGAIQNRLEHTIANLATSAENLTAAESRIRDVDIAVEMMNFTKYQILAQASTAMLAQANAKPQAVLQLLR
jgi:flagellin